MDLYDDAVRFRRVMDRGRRVLATRDLRGVSRYAVDARVRSGAAHRPYRGAYLFGETSPTFLERAKAALLVSPPTAVLGFDTAAAMHGFGILETTTIHLVVPAGTVMRPRRGIRIHQSAAPFEPVTHLGVPCTPAARTATDLARALPRMEALPVLDAALFARACTRDDFAAAVDLAAGLAGAYELRRLVPLADGRAQCRQESQLRLILHDGGFTGFVPQLPVCAGRVQYNLDLGDPKLKVGVEYDGRSHSDPARLGPDRERHNFLSDLGWRMRYITGFVMYRTPLRILTTVRRAAEGLS